MASPNERQRIQSVDRAVALLRAVSMMAPAEATLSALAERCDLNRSTACRLLATLRHHHFVEYNQTTNSYGIGYRCTCNMTWSIHQGLEARVCTPRLPRGRGERICRSL